MHFLLKNLHAAQGEELEDDAITCLPAGSSSALAASQLQLPNFPNYTNPVNSTPRVRASPGLKLDHPPLKIPSRHTCTMLQRIYSKEMLGLCQRRMLAKTLESNYELLLPGCDARSVGLENWSLRKAATLQDTTCLQYCVILACLCTLQNVTNCCSKHGCFAAAVANS